MAKPITAKVLAHEIAHILGAEHDGMLSDNEFSPYYEERLPCPENLYPMSPNITPEAKIWSNCTKKVIQSEHDRRNDFCFYI